MGDSSPSRQESVQKLVEGKNAFKGSAIRGSSLLNTVGDIRPFVQRGSPILVNGVTYDISLVGDWNANSVQLTTDYAGETNFDVSIVIPAGSFSPKRKKGGTAAKDSASSHASLAQSMDQLNSITEAFNVKLKLQDDTVGKPADNSGVRTKSNRSFIPKAPTKPKTLHAGESSNSEVSERTGMTPARPKQTKRALQPIAAEDADTEAADDDTNDLEVAKPKVMKPVKPKVAVTSSLAPTSARQGRVEAPTAPDNYNKQSALSARRERKADMSTGQRGESTDAAQDSAPAVASASAVTTDKSIDEQRKAAALRVQRKLKEEQARIEKIEAAKAHELKLQHEASVAKAKELQAKTALRVGKYMEENQRRAEQEKQAELYEQQQRELRNQEFLNSSRYAKMRDFRRDARNRLEQIAQADYRKAVEEEELVQKRLFERHKKYDANTTFLPRLDAPSLASGSTAGVGVIDEKKMKPGAVVKSIAVELEQFERESGNFPEEPVLRSRSARQATRKAAAGAVQGGGALPVIGSQQRQNSMPSVAPAAGSKKIAFSGVAATSKPVVAADEDDWSDDEPDLLLRGKENFLGAPNHSSSNVGDSYAGDGGDADYGADDGYDDDSLVNHGDNDEPDFENDFDNAMEQEIFGHLKVKGGNQGNQGKQVPAPVALPSVAQNSNNQAKQPVKGPSPALFQTPQQPAAKKAAPGARNTDGYVSDGSDITIDSMLGGGRSKGKNAAASSKHSAKKDTARPGQVKVVQPSAPAAAAAAPAQVQFQAPRAVPPATYTNANTNTNANASMYKPESVQLPSSYMSAARAPQSQHGSALLPGGPPPLLPYDLQQVKSQQGNHAHGGGSGSSNQSNSPTKPKVKNVFKKLKPIPISSPYRPIVNPV